MAATVKGFRGEREGSGTWAEQPPHGVALQGLSAPARSQVSCLLVGQQGLSFPCQPRASPWAQRRPQQGLHLSRVLWLTPGK